MFCDFDLFLDYVVYTVLLIPEVSSMLAIFGSLGYR